jgi:hypothetical protein
MLTFFFLFSCFIRDVPEPLTMLLVHPDSGLPSVYITVVSQLTPFLRQNISVKFIRNSDWNQASQGVLSPEKTHIVLMRNGRILVWCARENNAFDLSQTINSALYSHVDLLSPSSLVQYTLSAGPVFILANSSLDGPYEDAAFRFRNTKARFGFIKREALSLTFIDNRNDRFREWDGTVPMMQWILSCKTNCDKLKSQSVKGPDAGDDAEYSLIAVTDYLEDVAEKMFADLSGTFSFGTPIKFRILTWAKALQLQNLCMISPRSISYVIVHNPPHAKAQCYPFQDGDVASVQLMAFFVTRAVSGQYRTYRETEKYGRAGKGVWTIGGLNYETYIPDSKVPVVVHFENRNSISNLEARLIFDNLAEEIGGKGIVFYRIEQGKWTVNAPSADGFPLFVLYQPGDKQPFIFGDVLTPQSFRDWVTDFVDLNETVLQVNEKENLLSQVMSLLNKFTT